MPDTDTIDPEEFDLDDLIDWSAFEALEIEGINLKVESPPVKVRRETRPKTVTPWEELFAGLKSHPGIHIRAAYFNTDEHGEDYRKKASSRARNMRSRLVKTQPHDEWLVENVEDKEDGSFKIFISYVGPASAELVAERERVAAEAVKRGQAAAAIRNAERPAKSTAKK